MHHALLQRGRLPHRTITRLTARALALAASAAVVFAIAQARAGAPLPGQFDGVDIADKLGQQIDLDVPVVDHLGRQVKLADYFDGTRPVLLTLNYYRCESLCSTQLNELLKAVRELDWLPGGEAFRMVTLSFDPRDDTEIAAGKRDTYLHELARLKAVAEGAPTDAAALDARVKELDWEFLTAAPDDIRTLTNRLGYTYRFDEKTGQYAHSPVVYVLSPKGIISRYLFGITYPSRDLKFALMDASEGNIGSLGEKILLSCFAFDEASGTYSTFAWGLMRLGAVVVLLLLGGGLLIAWRRERRRARARLTPPTPTSPVA